MDITYWIRVLNVLLSSALIGICFSKAGWKSLSHARDARIAGLCFVALGLAWGSGVRRNEEFHPWLLFFTIGLSLCCYGMIRNAPGEMPFKRVRRKSPKVRD